MNNRQKMRSSNKRAIEYLILQGFTDIILRTHCKHKDFVYNKEMTSTCTDYWNLFDGMGYDRNGNLAFIQIKTNAWAAEKPIKDFVTRRKIPVIVINVTNKLKIWQVLVRKYDK